MDHLRMSGTAAQQVPSHLLALLTWLVMHTTHTPLPQLLTDTPWQLSQEIYSTGEEEERIRTSLNGKPGRFA